MNPSPPTRRLALALACLGLSTSTCPSPSQARPRAAQPTRARKNKKVKVRAAALSRAVQAPKPRRTVFVGTAPAMNARLIVPAIYIDAMLVQGLSDEALRLGPGHDPQSDLPGEPGNCVLAAHRNVWGAEFWHLPRLKPGNIVEVRTPHQRLIYRVKWARNIEGTDLSPLQQPGDAGISRLTLYTCTKPRTAARFIVSADLEQRLPSTPEMFKQQTLPFPPYHTPTMR